MVVNCSCSLPDVGVVVGGVAEVGLPLGEGGTSPVGVEHSAGP